MHKVSIIIPNYNGKKFLNKCLNALMKQEYTDFHVIIVDNASSDESLEIIDGFKNSLDIRVIELDKNHGFAGAVNIGIKASSSEFVILLNNDAYAGRHFIYHLVNRMEEDKLAFAGQAMMIQYNDRNKIDSAGDFFSALGWGFARGKDRPTERYNNEEEIFSACAGAAIYRKKILDEIGLFDEYFFAYLEDMDLCYRARLYGYHNLYIPRAKVYHVGSGTSGSRHNAYKVRISARNSMLVMYKNFATWQFALNFIPVMEGIIIKTIYFSAKGLGKAYIGGIKDAFSGLKNVKRTPKGRNNVHICWQLEKELFVNIARRIKGF